MTTTTLRSIPSARVAAPSIKTQGTGVLSQVWSALKLVGQARARRELLITARGMDKIRPEFAAQLRRTARSSWL